ncbi:MAG: aminoacyl-tRNA deacylase [Atopobiaceae bacterium]|nr:aminoacyl-tRNA deacylase [Atopobiaceae bacterium]
MARKDNSKKTNAMRELERAGVDYSVLSYDDDGERGHELGVHIAELLNKDPDTCFKTLVCTAASGGHVACCIPVAYELDLKKAAAALGEKSLSMLPLKELETVTGYVRGACTPLALKKPLPTLIDESALLFDEISISAGKHGYSLVLNAEKLGEHLGTIFADITREVQ